MALSAVHVAARPNATENEPDVRQAAIDALHRVEARAHNHPGWTLIVGVAIALALAVVILPPLLASGNSEENDVRSTLLQGLAGLFLAGGLYFTAQTLRLNREGQITERFTRAIDQLGDEKLDVRLGGIYALERVARSSREDHGPIMEVLTAYVREHAHWPPHPAEEAEDADSAEHREPDGDGARPSTDVQAVIAVLGRRVLGRKEHDLDLSSVDLRGARFGKGPGEGHFEKANFTGAQLDRAELRQAHLSGANLTRANLTGAHLELANLTEATVEVNVEGHHAFSVEVGANLTGADLTGAHLKFADLTGANLNGANLTEADLTEANLTRAYLEHADLTDAVYDLRTKWPEGFDPKAEGARLAEELGI
jgi:hypothetical protein